MPGDAAQTKSMINRNLAEVKRRLFGKLFREGPLEELDLEGIMKVGNYLPLIGRLSLLNTHGSRL